MCDCCDSQAYCVPNIADIRDRCRIWTDLRAATSLMPVMHLCRRSTVDPRIDGPGDFVENQISLAPIICWKPRALMGRTGKTRQLPAFHHNFRPMEVFGPCPNDSGSQIQLEILHMIRARALFGIESRQ